MRVHWSNKALSQLADLTEGLQTYSVAAAERLADDLIAASQKLAHFPHLGRALPENSYAEVRELLVNKYRLVYLAGDFQVEIIAVLHQAQKR